MLTQILIAVLVALVVLGGRGRITSLLGAAKHTPDDFRDAKARAEDPAKAARDVTPRDVTPRDDQP